MDGDGIKHYRLFENPAGRHYATWRIRLAVMWALGIRA